MDKNTKEQLEQSLQDHLDRMWACDAESEDYFKYGDKVIRIGTVLNETEKIESQTRIELKKLELEEEKLKHDSDWKNPKFLIGLCVPIGVAAVGTLYRSWYTANMLKDVCAFETNNTITSTPGKWVVRKINDIFDFKRGGLM